MSAHAKIYSSPERKQFIAMCKEAGVSFTMCYYMLFCRMPRDNKKV